MISKIKELYRKHFRKEWTGVVMASAKPEIKLKHYKDLDGTTVKVSISHSMLTGTSVTLHCKKNKTSYWIECFEQNQESEG
jgi:hypothetical protein